MSEVKGPGNVALMSSMHFDSPSLSSSLYLLITLLLGWQEDPQHNLGGKGIKILIDALQSLSIIIILYFNHFQ